MNNSNITLAIYCNMQQLRMAEEDIEVMKKKKAEAEDRLKSANITIKELKSARGKRYGQFFAVVIKECVP